MNKLAIALTAALSLGAAASANAADATIEFKGEIKDLTCTIGVGSATGTSLVLPTVTKSAVSNQAASRQKAFDLVMGTTAVPCATGNAVVSFEKDNVNAAGRLTNKATSGAANLELAIHEGGSALDLNNAELTHTFAASALTKTWNMLASYEQGSGGAVGEGSFETELLINVQYVP